MGLKPMPADAEPLKLFILAGQSNMDGQAFVSGLPEMLQAPQADVAFYRDRWTTLQPGSGKTSAQFGPEVTFGRAMADLNPDANIALLKYAVSGSNLYYGWNPGGNGRPTGSYYSTLMTKVADALASLGPDSTAEIGGVIWMQGESDASTPTMAATYEVNLTQFINSVRTDLGSPNLPFVIGQISEAPSWSYGSIVREAQYDVSRAVPNTWMVRTSDLTFNDDGIHYDAAGQYALGYRFAGIDMLPDAHSGMPTFARSYSQSELHRGTLWPLVDSTESAGSHSPEPSTAVLGVLAFLLMQAPVLARKRSAAREARRH